jgi:hypothetical protein
VAEGKEKEGEEVRTKKEIEEDLQRLNGECAGIEHLLSGLFEDDPQ